jgi:predicted nucleic acid-binding Zn ribbon protein
MEKNCPECGEKIIGRIDKIFCSDQCRNTYNNRQNRASTNLIRKINSKLHHKSSIYLFDILICLFISFHIDTRYQKRKNYRPINQVFHFLNFNNETDILKIKAVLKTI